MRLHSPLPFVISLCWPAKRSYYTRFVINNLCTQVSFLGDFSQISFISLYIMLLSLLSFRSFIILPSLVPYIYCIPSNWQPVLLMLRQVKNFLTIPFPYASLPVVLSSHVARRHGTPPSPAFSQATTVNSPAIKWWGRGLMRTMMNNHRLPAHRYPLDLE